MPIWSRFLIQRRNAGSSSYQHSPGLSRGTRKAKGEGPCQSRPQCHLWHHRRFELPWSAFFSLPCPPISKTNLPSTRKSPRDGMVMCRPTLRAWCAENVSRTAPTWVLIPMSPATALRRLVFSMEIFESYGTSRYPFSAGSRPMVRSALSRESR